MMAMVMILGPALCMGVLGDAGMGPLFQTQRVANRPASFGWPFKQAPKQRPQVNIFRLPVTQVQKQRPQFLAKGKRNWFQPWVTKAATQEAKKPTEPLSSDALKIRRGLELQRTFEKQSIPPGDPTNIALNPDSSAIPGKLGNGLTYVIIPNLSPPQRFEAHLEIMSGAADEEDRQQGMAHLVEHMTFLGSKKRGPLLGTGSKSNALTDFHHTVFHVDCPVRMPGTDMSMLPYALDLFRDILQSKFETSRFIKERAAVLSEMQMMNTIEYRLDCHILESLHAENRLSRRFPIGREDLILDWDLDEVRRFHRLHYRPSNAMLYIIGDLDTAQAVDMIEGAMGGVPPDHEDLEIINQKGLVAQQKAKIQFEPGKGRVGSHFPESFVGPLGEKLDPSIELQSMHFPPVLHRWVGGEFDNSCAVPVSPIDLAFTVAGAVRKSNPDALRERVKASMEKMRAANPATNVGDPDVVATLLADALSDSISDAMQKVQTPKVEFNPKALGDVYNVGLFHHQGLSSFSFHIYAKRPVEPVNDVQGMRHAIARRIAISAIQVRLSMKAKAESNVPFSYTTFEMMDYPREGCNVGSLDLSCDGKHWREAVAVSIMEVRRFGLYGITEGELKRYKQALLTNSEQAAALGSQGAVPNSELMEQLKETVACHHTWLAPSEAHSVCEQVMAHITKEEVNAEARDLTNYIVDFGKLQGEPLPSAIVAGVPPPLQLTNEMVIDAIKDGASREVSPVPDVVVPTTLMSPEGVAQLSIENPPSWAVGNEPRTDEYTGAISRELSNGIKVSYMVLPHEPSRGFVRIMTPGGRICERGPKGFGATPGAAAIGALTLQEGGYFDPWTRQQIELFMVDNLIQGQISCVDDSLAIDLGFSTVPVGDATVSGMEALLQFVNRILTPGKLTWEEDAFERAKDYLGQQHEQLICSVEGAATEKLMRVAANNDQRFVTLSRETLDKVTMQEAKETTLLQLTPSSLDIAIVGDLDLQETEKLILQYLGTIPKSDPSKEAQAKALYMNEARAPAPAPAPPLPHPDRVLRVDVEDSYARAAGYMSGPAPNRWGVLQDGRHIRDAVAELAPEGDYDSVGARANAAANKVEGVKKDSVAESVGPLGANEERWAHPLYAPVVISVLQEVINSRLFTTVRDRKQLTYDTNFQFTGYERMDGAYWMTYVTATPGKVDLAVKACHDTLSNLLIDGVDSLDIAPARRTVVKQHENEVRSNAYWASLLSGTQSKAWPNKNLGDLSHFHALVDAVTVGDLLALIQVIGIGKPDQCYQCIGASGKDELADEVGHTLPGAGHGNRPGFCR